MLNTVGNMRRVVARAALRTKPFFVDPAAGQLLMKSMFRSRRPTTASFRPVDSTRPTRTGRFHAMDSPSGVPRQTMLAKDACLLASTTLAQAATLKAEYRFNGTLASSIPGAPDLVSVNPLGLNGFSSDTVNGQTQQVFTWNGHATPVNEQAGFTLNTAGLVNATNYTVEMRFKFTDRNGAWRRIIDVSNRQSDSGFYVDPGNHLAVFPIISSVTTYTNTLYHDVILTVSGGTVSASLDGILQFSGNSVLMNITNAANPMIFFVDNNAAGGQGEFSNGSIALLRLYDGIPFAPVCNIQRTITNSVMISWPSTATGFILLQNPDLNPTNWTIATATPVDSGTNQIVVMPESAGQMFYRLRHP
jgi:hypothetical protein